MRRLPPPCLVLLAVAACAGAPASTHPAQGEQAGLADRDGVQTGSVAAGANDQGTGGPLQILDRLEGQIDAQTDDEPGRERAYKAVAAMTDDGSAGYALARAALAGRLAQSRGLSALRLVREAEHYARISRDRDPEFRDEEATLMLGSLQSLAGEHLETTNSEDGINLLEDLVARRPDDARRRLRLAEALLALGDVTASGELLCSLRSVGAKLRPSERRLLDDLNAQLERELGERNPKCDSVSGGPA